MHTSNRELWLAFIAILLITALYLFVLVTLGGIPAASEFFGHSLGILGFVLMLMTETLYTLRKRSRMARWGKMSGWLEFHIFTGLVGPYLVLLHSSWKFNGLAGIVMLLTVMIVASGFIGRYIYTAVPRTADGVEFENTQLELAIGETESELRRWLAEQPAAAQLLSRRLAGGDLAALSQAGAASISIQGGLFDRLQWRLAKGRLDSATRAQVDRLEELLNRRRLLRRQVASLAQARRLLALWYTVHIPIGMALFTAAAVHIAAAIYYATLLR